MIQLAFNQVIILHEDLLEFTGGRRGIRDEALLDSALHAPFQSFGGTDAYPSIYQKAARLGYGIIKNHPFIDGNKRTGAHVMLVFLALNGIDIQYSQSELVDMVLQTAGGDLDSQVMYEWISEHELKQ